MLQSSPPHPVGQTHLPPAQLPVPEQLLGQSRSVQSGPVQPREHTHRPPSMQLPWHVDGSDGSGQLHDFGHVRSSHAGPPQPGAHLHRLGAAHSPRPEQWLTPEQSERLHASPNHPAAHSHVYGAVQTPWLEQL